MLCDRVIARTRADSQSMEVGDMGGPLAGNLGANYANLK